MSSPESSENREPVGSGTAESVAASASELQNESREDYDLGPWPQIMEEAEAVKIPYGEQSEPDEWERSTAARIECASCGEWVYPRRPVGNGGPFVLPPNCDVCGAAT